ncbi:hypothetical protein OESDEN_12935, partial [Oesophagostomum dentatum]
TAEANRYRFCAIVSRDVPDWAVCGELNEGLESIHCVPQSNNSMVIQKLRSGKRYFITIFVRDSLHGSTSSYETLEVNLRKSPEKNATEVEKDEEKSLHDAVLETGTLPPKKGSTIDYQFVISSNATQTSKVLLIVHACDGYVRMSVFRNGKMLKRSEPFSGFRRFLVVNVHSGQLRFQISNDDSKPKSVHLWASTESEKSPYPKLPEDTSVKAVRRSCSTATLQWLRSADEHAEYCIYMRRENANYLEELVSRRQPQQRNTQYKPAVAEYKHIIFSVKAVRRSCSTATLQWLRSADEHAEYCIYMRRENANYLEELVSRETLKVQKIYYGRCRD